MLYLDETTLEWAKESDDVGNSKHLDSNGAILENGDTVVLIKTLDVKGSNLVIKRGTTVKNIRLVEEDTGQIEGKVEGQKIVILTKYLRKS